MHYVRGSRERLTCMCISKRSRDQVGLYEVSLDSCSSAQVAKRDYHLVRTQLVEVREEDSPLLIHAVPIRADAGHACCYPCPDKWGHFELPFSLLLANPKPPIGMRK